VANGIYQNSIYGTAALFPMKYTSVVVLGSVSTLFKTEIVCVLLTMFELFRSVAYILRVAGLIFCRTLAEQLQRF
jgi:hypothetical protein